MRRYERCAIPLLLLATTVALSASAQQTASPEKATPKDTAEALAFLHAAEVAHPGNTLQVAAALNAVIDRALDEDAATPETLVYAARELAVAEAAAGPHSKAFVSALSDMSEVNVVLSHPADARPYAERAFEIAQKEFPGDEEGINAADQLAYVCSALGDRSCAQHADETALALERKPGPDHEWDLAVTLSNYSELKERMGDEAGAGAAIEEALTVGRRARPDDAHLGIFENNAATHFIRTLEFPKALSHLNQAIKDLTRAYGPSNPLVLAANANLADVYGRMGEFGVSWKSYESALSNHYLTVDELAQQHATFARSLAAGGDLPRAVQQGLIAAGMGRESFVLQARTLPERQALAYVRQRPRGVDTALSVLLLHPEMPAAETYQEIMRSRALVADEMARRQRNLNADNDPEVGRLLTQLTDARTNLLAVEHASPAASSDAIAQATARMEKVERALAERSASARREEHEDAMELEDVRRNLPLHSVLISYMIYTRRVVGAVDPTHSEIPSYMAFVLHPDSGRTRLFDLGDAKSITEMVTRARSAADAQAIGGGLGSARSERLYRDAAGDLRKRIWDPLRAELKETSLALIVPDGVLNLIPFSSLPDGKGYLVEHAPVIHILTSERDLVKPESHSKKLGLLAIGDPHYGSAGALAEISQLRGSTVSCEEFRKLQFKPLPGSMAEVGDLAASWRRWNAAEPSALLTGAGATRARFLEEASSHRILHVATHAFLLDRSCGNGNPLLQAGLVFAGANQDRDGSIVTAQQIASLDLNGVEWAVLSACNTGNGELRDGEGVLGLQRAFRVAGAHSVIMTLWPVDDDAARQFMHELYAERLGHHASTADAVWSSARKLLLDRRSAGKSTHPWYWAGFVGSGAWE